MGMIKQLLPGAVKFNPASTEVNWTRIETLIHGPGASDDKRTINSAVFACLLAYANAYPEPELKVFRKSLRAGSSSPVPNHPLQLLLDRPTPNGELTLEEILWWTAWAKHCDGNAYWMKVRSGDEVTGNVVEIWPVSPTVIEPVTEGADKWISYYKYQYAPGQFTPIPIENIIHFKLGIDDKDMRRGISPLKALIREISSDDEATRFTATLLKNYAVPGLVVIPSGGTTVSEDDAERITQKLSRKFGSDNRGNIAVMSRESTIQQFGFSPEQLQMNSLHALPESRITAVMRVPAIVAGLGVGLDASTYSNFGQAMELFTEKELIPGWRFDAARLNASLTPDFANQTRQIFLDFDITNVRSLQEDEDAKYTRLQKAVGKPWVTINEAREDTGYDAIDGGDDLAQAQQTVEQVDETQQQEQQPPDNANGESSQNGNPARAGSEETQKDLRRWERFALRNLKEGKAADREFIGGFIPAELRAGILAGLKNAKTPEEVRAVFDDPQPEKMIDGMLILALELRRANDLLERTASPA